MEPWCRSCRERLGLAVKATPVDHIVPHRGDPELFWDESKWPSLCSAFHARKTSHERPGYRGAGGQHSV